MTRNASWITFYYLFLITIVSTNIRRMWSDISSFFKAQSMSDTRLQEVVHFPAAT